MSQKLPNEQHDETGFGGYDEPADTELAIECALDWINARFPPENGCPCFHVPVATFDKHAFRGFTGGFAIELIAYIQWALADKHEHTFRELVEVNS